MNDTATNTVNRELDIIGFDKMKELLEQKPQIIAVNYQIAFPFKVGEILPENTIVISKDLAVKLKLWKED